MLRLACALLLALLSTTAAAAPAEAPRRVIVAIAADDAEAMRFAEVVSELLQRIEVEASFVRSERIDARLALTPDRHAEPALARAWVDLRNPAEARLLLVDRDWERALSRVIDRRGSSDEVVREEIAHVIQSASETLLAGSPVGEPRAELERRLGLQKPSPPRPPSPPPPAPRAPALPPLPPPGPPLVPTPPWRLGAGLFYEGQGYASEQVIVHGPGIAVDIDAPEWTLGPGLELTAQYRIPFEVEGDVAAVRLQSAVLRLLARLSVWRATDIALQAAVGAGIDVLHLEPSVIEGANARAEPARTRVAPLIRPALSARVRLFGDTALWLALGGDIDLIGVRYVIRHGEEDVPLVEPLRFRPFLLVGLSATLAGGSLFVPSP